MWDGRHAEFLPLEPREISLGFRKGRVYNRNNDAEADDGCSRNQGKRSPALAR